MQAIETQWRGFNFRSRLEARYAVLFEALGLDWQYESQGYKLSDGRKYLPDFYLRDFSLYIEVKGTPVGDDTHKLLRAFKHPLLLVVGLPEFQRPNSGLNGEFYGFSVSEGGGMPYICNAHIMQCVKCHKWVVDLRADDSRLNRDRQIVDRGNDWDDWGPHCKHGYHDLFRTGAPVKEATKTAKSARFEHGESPTL